MALGMVGVKVSLSVWCRIQTGPEGKANISETKPSVAQETGCWGEGGTCCTPAEKRLLKLWMSASVHNMLCSDSGK